MFQLDDEEEEEEEEQMTNWIDVYKLFKEVPPRQPRGSPENKLRNGPVQKFLAAKKRYERENGCKWTYSDFTGPREYLRPSTIKI